MANQIGCRFVRSDDGKACVCGVCMCMCVHECVHVCVYSCERN